LRIPRAAASSLVLLAFAACAGQQNSVPLPPFAAAPSLVVAHATKPAQTVYVADYSVPPGAIDELTTSGKPVAKIYSGVFDPTSIVVDASGTLSVANAYPGYGTITQYPPGATSPVFTITYGIAYGLYSLVLDADGQNDLYALSITSRYYAPFASVYAPGSTQPLATIEAGLCAPSAAAVDGAGTYYVANLCLDGTPANAGVVVAYAPKMGAVSRIITDEISDPTAMVLDPKGSLYVVNGGNAYNGADTITKYGAGRSTASESISLLETGTTCASLSSQPVVDASGSLYVAFSACLNAKNGVVSRQGRIARFAPGSKRPDLLIKAPTGKAFGSIAVDAGSNIYAVLYSTTAPVDSEVVRYAKGSTRRPRKLLAGTSLGQILIR
jgi:hypothetical protein